MEIQDNAVVSMHYTLKDDEGEIIDTSEGHEPLQFLHGAGNIIPGLESELAGKKVGDAIEVTVDPESGYGEHDEGLIQTVEKSAFQGVDDLQVGMRFQAQTEGGPLPVRITEIEGETVTVDGNHELAGMRLHFSVSIAGVREATAEELEHGHVHGPGGHQH